MFSKLTRTAFVALALLGASVEAFAGNYAFAALCAFIAAGLVLGHFRYGATRAAFLAYRRGSLDDVVRHLAEIRYPSLLAPRSRADYELLSGIVAHRDGAFDLARAHLTAALLRGVRTPHMVAVVRVHLADVALQSGDREAGTLHLDAARAAPHQQALDEAIDALAQQLRGP